MNFFLNVAMKLRLVFFVGLASVFVLTATITHADEAYPVTIERGVTTTMRDGVVLRSDIYRPKADGKFPVLLQRTPYNKNNGVNFGVRAAARGFVVIFQDVRGRYSSEGDWYTFKHESDDGYDSVEWAAALPYSNGKVGMFGGSYVGATQMLAAIAHPPHLAGICPVVTASNYHDGWTYQGGAFEQWFNQSWTSGLAQDTFNRKVAQNTNALSGMWKLPLTSYPLFNFPDSTAGLYSSAALAPYFLDWLAHPSYDDYWNRLSIEEHYGDINVPALTIAAWYDIFQAGSLRNYVGLRVRGGQGARATQRLLVEYLFKGVQNNFAKEKPVKIFVMGRNEWREEDDWPLARAHSVKYFLHSEGNANSLRGRGGLSVESPHSDPADHYVYDPARPVPTVGGPLCCDGEHMPPGPRDQRAVEARDDVLIYSTPAFAQDTEVTGPVSLELFAKSSAVDTDFTAKLVDVAPDGFAQNLTEGIIRARYRDSQEKPALMNPGQIYKFTVDLWSTSNVFLKGHILRLEVSSSNFPRFDRNLNTGEPAGTGLNYVPATNTIYHDAEHPSVLTLPVVESH